MKTSPHDLIVAIAGCWPQIETAVGGSKTWQQFSAALLQKLRAFEDADADHEAIARDIAALFAQQPEANRVLKTALGLDFDADDTQLGSPLGRDVVRIRSETEPGDAAVPLPSRHTRLNVLYGTDRARVSADEELVQYSAERADQLSFGVAEVSVPDDHRKGRLERPRWYRLEFRENPDRHVVVTGMQALGRAEFVVKAQQAIAQDRSANEAMIFVHGYNVDFQAAVLRTAQLACDLEFRGMAIAYSWPSEGALVGYASDANVTELSMFLLAEFIRFVQSELGLARIHIIAHSMGSRVVARALDRLSRTTGARGGAELHHLVFAAPDMDPKTFDRFAQAFVAHCERCTLYASSRDLALSVSSLVYQFARAGDASEQVMVVKGVDTIDATNVDTSLLGHSYFSDRRTLLADLFLLFTGLGPDRRFGLHAIVTPDGKYWEFRA